MHHNSLREEEFFSEYYADTFSDCLSDICTSVSEDDSSSKSSCASGNVTIRLIKIQKAFVIDSDTENETLSAGDCACASTAEWTEDNKS